MKDGNSKLITDLAAKKLEEYDKPPQEKKAELKNEPKVTNYRELSISAEQINLQDKLKEAVIWSEILGKPLSKRRKRR